MSASADADVDTLLTLSGLTVDGCWVPWYSARMVGLAQPGGRPMDFCAICDEYHNNKHSGCVSMEPDTKPHTRASKHNTGKNGKLGGGLGPFVCTDIRNVGNDFRGETEKGG